MHFTRYIALSNHNYRKSLIIIIESKHVHYLCVMNLHYPGLGVCVNLAVLLNLNHKHNILILRVFRKFDVEFDDHII